jgi:hypothetical protein
MHSLNIQNWWLHAHFSRRDCNAFTKEMPRSSRTFERLNFDLKFGNWSSASTDLQIYVFSSTNSWDWKGYVCRKDTLNTTGCLGGTTAEKRLVMKSLANFDRKLTDDEYNWMMEGRAKVGLCDGLLNLGFSILIYPIFENFRTVKLVVSTLDRSTRSWITWVVQ